jgi:hypothetical protein
MAITKDHLPRLGGSQGGVWACEAWSHGTIPVLGALPGLQETLRSLEQQSEVYAVQLDAQKRETRAARETLGETPERGVEP